MYRQRQAQVEKRAEKVVKALKEQRHIVWQEGYQAGFDAAKRGNKR